MFKIRKFLKKGMTILTVIGLFLIGNGVNVYAESKTFRDEYEDYVVGSVIPQGVVINTLNGPKDLSGYTTISGNLHFKSGSKTATAFDSVFCFKEKGNQYFQIGWCIDPFTEFPLTYASMTTPGAYAILDTQADIYTNVSEENVKKIKEYVAIGWGYQNDFSAERHLATQILIWKAVYPDLEITGSAYTTDVKTKEKEIADLISNHSKKPNFTTNSQIKDGKYVLSGIGEENAISLKDTEGVLSNYLDTANGGYVNVSDNIGYSYSDNILKVWAKNTKSKTGTLYADNDDYVGEIDYGKKDKLLVGNKHQNIIDCTGALDPQFFNLAFEIEAGQLTLEKQDSETGKTVQGDATFTGAQYSLIGSDNKNYGTFTIQANGKSNSIKDLDTSLTYTVKETKAPAGYVLNPNTYTIEYTGDTTKINKVVKDNVIKGYLEITKILDTNDGESGLVSYEEGAEFTAILKSYADKVGGFDKALAEIKEGKSPLKHSEYSVMTTNEDGYAKSGALAYGTYYVKQTGAKDGEIKLMTTQIEAKISKQGEVKSYMASNKTQK